MLDNKFVIQKDGRNLLSVLEWVLCVAKRAKITVLWKRENERILLLVPIKNDEERERLRRGMEDLASDIGEISFRMFSEGKYKEKFPCVPKGATLLCVDEAGNIIFLQ